MTYPINSVVLDEMKYLPRRERISNFKRIHSFGDDDSVSSPHGKLKFFI